MRRARDRLRPGRTTPATARDRPRTRQPGDDARSDRGARLAKAGGMARLDPLDRHRVRDHREALPRAGNPDKTGLTRISIGSLDDSHLGIEAQYNPKDISIEQSWTWSAQKNKGNVPDLAFGGGGGRVMTIELVFDGFERGLSVQPSIDALVELSRVRDLGSSKDEMLRPHTVAVVWGDMESLRGVIESISTKLTVFAPGGAPLRATVSVKIREVSKIVPAK